MLGTTVYNAVLDSIRADHRGNSLQPDEFNRLSEIINRRLLSDLVDQFEEGVDVSSKMGAFKKVDQVVNLVSGVGVLPADYYQIIGEQGWYVDTTDSTDPSATRDVELVTSMEHSKRRTDYLKAPSAKYPHFIIGTENASGSIQIRVYPSTISSIYVDYWREPATPFLDYTINDTTLETTFLTEGQTVTVSSGTTYRDGTTGVKTSLTQDWEWGVDDLPVIVAYFRSELGAILPDPLSIEVGEKDKQELK